MSVKIKMTNEMSVGIRFAILGDRHPASENCPQNFTDVPGNEMWLYMFRRNIANSNETLLADRPKRRYLNPPPNVQ